MKITSYSMAYKSILALALAIPFFLGAVTVAHAASSTIDWDGDTSVTWATGGNWTGGVAPANDATATGDVARFNLASYTTPFFAPSAGTTSVRGLIIGSSSGALTITTTNLTLGAAGVNMENGAAATSIGQITFSTDASVINNSANTLTLTGANVFTGKVTFAGTGNIAVNTGGTGAGGAVIDGANIIASNNSTFGTGTIEFKSGSFTQNANSSRSNNIVISGDFLFRSGGNTPTFTGTKSTTGNVVLTFQQSLTSSSATGNNFTFSTNAMVLGGDMEVKIIAGGTTGTYGVKVSLGPLDMGSANRKLTLSHSAGSLTVGQLILNGNLTIDGATTLATTLNGGFDTGGVNRTLTVNNSGSGVATLSGAVAGTASTLTLAGSTTNFAVGALTGATAHAINVNSTTGGGFLFNGASTYTGGTTLTQGTITLGASSVVASGVLSTGPLGTGTLKLGSGTNAATFQTNVANTTTRTVSNNISMDGDVTFATTTTTGRIALNVLKDAAAGNALTVPNTITLTRTNSLTVNSGVTLDLVGAISGSTFGITKLGAGTLNIGSTGTPDTMANTFNGLTTVSAGNVTLNKAASTDAIAGNLLIDGTGTVTLGANNENINNGSTVTVNTGGTLAMNARSETVGNLVVAGGTVSTTTGTLTTAGAGSVTVGSSSGTSLVSSALVLGSGGLLINPSGTGAATVSGGVTSTGSGTNVTITNAGNGAVSISAINNQGAILNNGGGSGTTTISGVIGTNVTGVTQNSATSQLTLSNAANTYTGPTTISSGTLSAGVTGNLGAAASNLVFDGGTLQITGNTLTSASTLGHTIVLNAGKTVGLDINSSTNTFTYDQVLSQTTGGLTKLGVGTLVLNQVNTYTGPTVIEAGTLQLNGTTGSLSTSSAITVNGTGKFSVSGTNSLVQGTQFSAGPISGSGSFVMASGSGTTTTLNDSNTYTGTTSLVSTGTLVVSSLNSVVGGTASSSLGAPTTVANGTISMGSGGSSTTLSYVGSGETTDRVINLAGVGGGGRLEQSGTGLLKFTSDLTATGAGSKSLGLQGSTAGIGEFAGVIVDNSAVNTTGISKNGTGTWILSGANTFTGVTTILQGILSVSSFNSVVGGTATSSLGAPTTVATGTIQVGNSSVGGQLTYTGSGETTDRVLNLNGSSGGLKIDQSGTGLLKFSSDLTATGAGSKTLTLQGSTTGTGEIGGAIVDNSGTNKTSVAKSGTGTWTLSGNNSYTGNTSVSNGTLLVNSTGNINSSGAVSVTGGTFRYDSTTGLTRNVTLNGGKFSYNSASNYAGTLTFTSGTIGGSNISNLDLTFGTGKIMSPGNSTGTMAAGATTWATGGTFLFELNDTTGTAGSTSLGWDLLNASSLNITAGTGEFTIQIASLDNLQAAGNALNFDGTSNYTWLFVDAGATITGFNAAKFLFDETGFLNSTPGTFSISQGTGLNDDKLYLNYTGVIPEPSTYALLAGGLGLLAFLRRRSKA